MELSMLGLDKKQPLMPVRKTDGKLQPELRQIRVSRVIF
jgi:hypothetical protein